MGKLLKTYREGKARLDVFENKNRMGKTYHIFKLTIYTYGKPKPLILRKNNVHELKKILEGIHIMGYEDEDKEVQNG